LLRLERSNGRWRGAAVALLAGAVGLVAGGMGQPRHPAVPDARDESAMGYQYVTIGESIYRIDKFGQISYLNVGGGFRTAEGYVGWGRVRVDHSRQALDKP
jgi:hypothetical protein